jgi:hypothetical protein
MESGSNVDMGGDVGSKEIAMLGMTLAWLLASGPAYGNNGEMERAA